MGEACQKTLALWVIDAWYLLLKLKEHKYLHLLSLVGLVFFPINTCRASSICQYIFFSYESSSSI